MTSIFTPSHVLDGTTIGDYAGYSTRMVCTITGNAQGQVRVTLYGAPDIVTFDHASIGISNGTGGETTGTPTELKFGGSSGGTIPVSGTLVSDWLVFAGFTSSDKLVVTVDISGGKPAYENGITNVNCFRGTTPSYNQIAPAGFTELDGFCFMVSEIDTQVTPHSHTTVSYSG